MHFHTAESTPGYLSDADTTGTFATEAEAVAAANAEAREYVASIEDEHWLAGTSFEPVKVSVVGEGTGYVIVLRSDRLHDLGRSFAVEGCVEVDCAA